MQKTLHNEAQTVLVGLLRELREAAGLRQVDLAEQLGRHQSFVSKYESGERRLDIIEVRQIANELGTDLPAVVRHLEQRLRPPPRSRRS